MDDLSYGRSSRSGQRLRYRGCYGFCNRWYRHSGIHGHFHPMEEVSNSNDQYATIIRDRVNTHSSTMCINYQSKSVELADSIDARGTNTGLAILGVP